jgi:hypothetical protein
MAARRTARRRRRRGVETRIRKNEANVSGPPHPLGRFPAETTARRPGASPRRPEALGASGLCALRALHVRLLSVHPPSDWRRAARGRSGDEEREVTKARRAVLHRLRPHRNRTERTQFRRTLRHSAENEPNSKPPARTSPDSSNVIEQYRNQAGPRQETTTRGDQRTRSECVKARIPRIMGSGLALTHSGDGGRAQRAGPLGPRRTPGRRRR